MLLRSASPFVFSLSLIKFFFFFLNLILHEDLLFNLPLFSLPYSLCVTLDDNGKSIFTPFSFEPLSLHNTSARGPSGSGLPLINCVQRDLCPASPAIELCKYSLGSYLGLWQYCSVFLKGWAWLFGSSKGLRLCSCRDDVAFQVCASFLFIFIFYVRRLYVFQRGFLWLLFTGSFMTAT